MRKIWIVVLLCVITLFAGCTTPETTPSSGTIHLKFFAMNVSGKEYMFDETEMGSEAGMLTELVWASTDGRLSSFKMTHDGAVKSCRVTDGFSSELQFSERVLKIGDVFVDADKNLCICLKEIQLESCYIGHVNIHVYDDEDLFADEETQIDFSLK